MAGTRSRLLLLAIAALALAGSVSCAATGPSDAPGEVRVAVGFYPLQFVAEQVGGDRVTVTNLALPGVEPHDMELSPSQVASIADADLILYIAGFQPAVDEAVGQRAAGDALDVSGTVALLAASEDHGSDPHLWLDPTRLAAVAGAVAEHLAARDPDGATAYRDRATALKSRLSELDAEFARGLATCQRREIVVSHAAFGYLADRYDLAQISISGLSPEVEPTPQRLAEVAAEARAHGATTIFFETLVSPKVAEAIAAEVGATTAVLDPVEGLPAGSTGDYVSVMRENLTALRPALGCT